MLQSIGISTMFNYETTQALLSYECQQHRFELNVLKTPKQKNIPTNDVHGALAL